MITSLWGKLACALAGHDHTIRQANGRMFLYCETCGHRTSGIVLTGREHLASSARHAPPHHVRHRSSERPSLAAR